MTPASTVIVLSPNAEGEVCFFDVEPQLVLEENFDVVQPELLELHTAKVMHVGRMAFHLLQLEFHLGLRQDLCDDQHGEQPDHHADREAAVHDFLCQRIEKA